MNAFERLTRNVSTLLKPKLANFAHRFLNQIVSENPSNMWGRVYDLEKKRLVNLNGFSIYVMGNDYIGRSILKTKTYETHVTSVMKGILGQGKCFMDLGFVQK